MWKRNSLKKKGEKSGERGEASDLRGRWSGSLEEGVSSKKRFGLEG